MGDAFDDAAFGDGEIAGEEGGGSVDVIAPGEAAEDALVVVEVVVDATVDLILIEAPGAGVDVVVDVGDGVGDRVGLGVILDDIAGDGVDHGLRNDVAGELIANEAGALGAGREGIKDADEGAVGDAGVTEVTLALQVGGHGEDGIGEGALAEAFVAAEEEGLVLDDGAIDHGAELVAFEAAEGDAGAVAEEIVGVEFRVPEELEKAAMKAVGAGFVDHVDHAAIAAAEFGGVVRAHHLEFGDGFDGREGGVAREAVDGRVGGADAIHEDVEHGIAGAVDAEAGAVGGADAAGDAGGEIEQGVDVAGIEREFDDALVVNDLAEDRVHCFEKGGISGDFHRFGDAADFEADVHTSLLADGKLNAAAEEMLKSGGSDFDLIFAADEFIEGEVAVFIRGDRSRPSGGGIIDADFGAGDDAAAGIGDGSNQAPGERLAKGAGRKRRTDDTSRTARKGKDMQTSSKIESGPPPPR